MRKRKGLSSAEVLYKNTNKNRQTFSQLNSKRNDLECKNQSSFIAYQLYSMVRRSGRVVAVCKTVVKTEWVQIP